MKLPADMSLEELRAMRTTACKRVANVLIESVYPIWKQVNILRDGTADEIQSMRVEINAVRNKSNALESWISAMTREELIVLQVQQELNWR